MSEETLKRATVYFEPALHQAIRVKAAHTNRSVSDTFHGRSAWTSRAGN